MESVILGSTGMSCSVTMKIAKLTNFCRMKEHAGTVVSDEAFAKRHERWPANTPDTKEGYYIRDIFDGKLHST